MHIIIHTDGGARGNPGPAAIGVVIDRLVKEGETKEIVGFGKRIGETTNNVAEYTAVIEALSYLKENTSRVLDVSPLSVQFYLDSTLVVHQINGLYKVKQPHLRELLTRVRILEQEVAGDIRYAAVPREENVRADLLVNKALDGS